MKLKIHPKASENFNTKIEELKAQLRFKYEPKKTEKVANNPDIHVSGVFDETNIKGEVKLHWQDSNGNIAARAFGIRGKLLGLFDEDYKNLHRIAENLQKSTNPKNVVSVELISEVIFDWIKQNYLGANLPQMTEFVLAECEKHIIEAEIWIPISELHIQVPFNLGKVTLRTITKEFMDNYENSTISKLTKPEDVEPVKQYFTRKRSQIQNRAVSIIKVEAEPRLAYQIAFEETERALSVLRLYSPTNLHPTKTCYVAPLEKQHKDGNVYLVVKDEKVIEYVSGISDKTANHWNLSKRDLDEYKTIGLGFLSNLLTTDTLTDFQQKLLEALFLYSRATLSKELSDRLVYTLVTLETIFVKDRKETLQDNISLRMAQMHPVSVQERKEIIKNIKAAYALRSSFIHHGESIDIDDLETLKKFMCNTWLSLIEVVLIASKDITTQEFFEELENRRVGG
jgi:hypothetical protein